MLCSTALAVGDAFDDSSLFGPCAEAPGGQSWRPHGPGYRNPR